MVSDGAAFMAVVRALDAAFVRHLSAGELDQVVAACYAEDAVLPPNLPLARGRGQVRERFRELLEAGVVRATLPCHAAAAIGSGVGRYPRGCHRPDKEAARHSGAYMLVYRRQADGAWKIVVEMVSSELPAA